MLGVPPDAAVGGDDGTADEGALATARTYTCAAIRAAPRVAIAGIPQLLVMVHSMEGVDGGCANALVGDPTGDLHACLAKRVLEEGGPELAAGAVLLLRNVSVFSSGGTKHLNVTPDAVVALTPPGAPAARHTNPYLFK